MSVKLRKNEINKKKKKWKENEKKTKEERTGNKKKKEQYKANQREARKKRRPSITICDNLPRLTSIRVRLSSFSHQ